jgi:hypothetical protein
MEEGFSVIEVAERERRMQSAGLHPAPLKVGESGHIQSLRVRVVRLIFLTR